MNPSVAGIILGFVGAAIYSTYAFTTDGLSVATVLDIAQNLLIVVAALISGGLLVCGISDLLSRQFMGAINYGFLSIVAFVLGGIFYYGDYISL